MTPDNAQTAVFKKALAQLNTAQRAAVDQVEGPVLVLAGPGTGKTQVLATRIGNILVETDARPQNILCLTFTDAGVQAMRQRLLQLIGPDAHRVAIMTYHSFCNRVIQENSLLFGGNDPEPVSDLERIAIIRQLFDQLTPEHPLREGFKNPYQLETLLGNLFSTMKSEGWKPGDVQKEADRWLRSLPENEEYIFKRNTKTAQKGDIKAEKIAEDALRMERLKAAADLFPAFNRALQNASRYEYEDMLMWTLRAFDQYPDLLRNYQERYLYVLVDEYQDTNGAQNQLLDRLLNYWESPNIFIVGDDDQSIFEFQGARLESLLEFYQQHRLQLLTIALTENYRSSQKVLDTAAAVIENNDLRAVNKFDIDIDKSLHAAKITAKDPGLVERVLWPDILSEETAVADQIGSLLKSGVSPGEIAVIFAQHRQSERLLVLLGKKGIPYQTRRPVDILQLPLVRHLVEILRYFNDEMTVPFSGEHRVFRILHAPFFQIPPIELARMALVLRENPDITWREALLESEWPLARQLAEMAGYDELSLPISLLLEQIITRLGLMNWVLVQPDKTWLLQVLSTWSQFVRTETVKKAEPLPLCSFLEMLDSMKSNRLAVRLQQSVLMEEGVQILSAHGAKGLEFNHVFIPGCTKEFWEPRLREGNFNFKLPPTLTRSGEEDAMEARRRLFYVALTRARQFLHISSAAKDEQGKALVAARFADETRLEITERRNDSNQMLETQAFLLTAPGTPVITLPDPTVFQAFLEHFSLSARGLNKYLRCPLAYYYEEVLRVPLETSESAAVGLAMHSALQYYFLSMQKENQYEFPPAEKLTDLFEQEMQRQKGRFPAQNWEQRLQTGKNTLARYRTEQISYWKKRARVEFRFQQVLSDDVPLNGAVDKIEYLDDNTLRVVDYKTGIQDKRKVARPDEAQPYGGEYFRQLLFYKILIDQSGQFTERVSKGVISWLEPGKKNNFSYDELIFSAADNTWMKNLIVTVANNIRALKFSTGCDDPHCPWCRMVREQQYEGGAGLLEEDLDDMGF